MLKENEPKNLESEKNAESSEGRFEEERGKLASNIGKIGRQLEDLPEPGNKPISASIREKLKDLEENMKGKIAFAGLSGAFGGAAVVLGNMAQNPEAQLNAETAITVLLGAGLYGLACAGLAKGVKRYREWQIKREG